MKVFADFVTQYCELQDETTYNGKSANAAFRCVKIQLLTRSGSLCGDKTVFEHFGKIVVANQKSRTERTFLSPKSQKTVWRLQKCSICANSEMQIPIFLTTISKRRM